MGLRILLSHGLALLRSVFGFVLAQLFLLDSKQEIFHSQNRCAFSLKERDDGEQNVQQLLDQLLVALIEFAPFDAIDELLDLVRISGGNVIVVFHRRRSRRSYARRKRTPRPELKYFLFRDCLLHGHARCPMLPANPHPTAGTLPCRESYPALANRRMLLARWPRR